MQLFAATSPTRMNELSEFVLRFVGSVGGVYSVLPSPVKPLINSVFVEFIFFGTASYV